MLGITTHRLLLYEVRYFGLETLNERSMFELAAIPKSSISYVCIGLSKVYIYIHVVCFEAIVLICDLPIKLALIQTNLRFLNICCLQPHFRSNVMPTYIYFIDMRSMIKLQCFSSNHRIRVNG